MKNTSFTGGKMLFCAKHDSVDDLQVREPEPPGGLLSVKAGDT